MKLKMNKILSLSLAGFSLNQISYPNKLNEKQNKKIIKLINMKTKILS